MINFHVGMKVVCIDEHWTDTDFVPNGTHQDPVKGGVYTVVLKQWVAGSLYLRLSECPNLYESVAFRPAVEPDISIFLRMLEPVKEDA